MFLFDKTDYPGGSPRGLADPPAEGGGGESGVFLEGTAEGADVAVSAFAGDGLDRQIGVPDQFVGPVEAQMVEELPEGDPLQLLPEFQSQVGKRRTAA